MRHLNEVYVFASVVEHGSFTKAAETLALSRALVSREISKLEKRYGVKLMNRSTRRLTLTESGKDFYRSCRVIIDELERVEQQLSEAQSEAQGLLKVWCPQAFGEIELSPLLHEYLSANPKVDIELAMGTRTPDLLAEGYDVAIQSAFHLPDSSLIAKALRPLEFIPIASKEFVARHGEPAHPHELVNYPLITNLKPSDIGGLVFLDQNDEEINVELKTRALVSSGQTMLELVGRGLGYTFHSNYFLDRMEHHYDFVRLLQDFKLPPVGRFLVWPHREYQPAKVSTFLHFIEAHFR